MRQSPSLLALLTVSATLGFTSQARGESLAVPPQDTANAPTVSVAELLAPVDGTAEFLEAVAVQTLPTVADLDDDASVSRRGPVQSTETALAELADEPIAASVVTLDAANAFTTVEQLSQPAIATTELAQSPRVPAESDEEPATPRPEQPDPEPTPPEIPDVPPPEVPSSEPEPDTEATPPIPPESEVEEADDPQPQPRQQRPSGTDQQTQVLVAEIAVADADGQPLAEDLEDTVYGVLTTRAGQTTTRSQIQQDINNIFATGLFSNVGAVPSDTPLGVRVTFQAEPNPILSQVRLEGNDVLPNEIVEDIFNQPNDTEFPGYGEIINLLEVQNGILELNNWYQENGYVLAQVVAAPQVTEDGIITLQVAEGIIEDIEIQFLTDEGRLEDDEGNPIRGKTRDFIITREFETQPGDVFQQSRIQTDLQRAFGLGIFDDINLTLNPGEKDPRQVRVIVNVVERSTGSVAAGLGFNFTGDVFGTLSYRQDNFGGNNQKLSAETQLSTRDLLFDISFTDPWIGGDPNRTSYTVNAFARRSIPLVFEGGDNEIDLDNGDRVRVNRFGGGVNFRRPLGRGWQGSLGTVYQRIRTTDADGNTFTEDEAGNPLTASDTGIDDLWTFRLSLEQDSRDNPFATTRGSVFRISSEQSVPLGSGNILLNRIRSSYSYYLPVSLLNFNEGPQTIAFNLQGGTIIGDLPPYEAFTLGGTNSIRGYDEGEVGAGRSYAQASVEYRFPLFSFLGGAVFVDAGTDLGTGDNVPGSPGPDRDKPGSGFGYGAGVRVQTPLGPIRVDYGISDQGDGRLHFGIGERF
ncbi:MAG: BamA/TamA family outer membrane protein [Cyanobacteria bacterium J06638_28]